MRKVAKSAAFFLLFALRYDVSVHKRGNYAVIIISFPLLLPLPLLLLLVVFAFLLLFTGSENATRADIRFSVVILTDIVHRHATRRGGVNDIAVANVNANV